MEDFNSIKNRYDKLKTESFSEKEDFGDTLERLKEVWQSSIKGKEEFEEVLLKLKGDDELSVKDIVSIDDLTLEDIDLIFRLTYPFKHEFITRGSKKIPLLKGKSIINFFAEESTRTRTSFELAGKHLSADTINVSKSSSSMAKKGETLNDTARNLDAMMADVVILRHAKGGAPQMIAKEITAPVINAGDGLHEHPTQGLLDAYTIWEKFGTVKDKLVVVVGDIKHSRVAGSLIRILVKLEANVRLCAPATLMPEKVAEVFPVEIYTEIDQAITGVDVVYALRPQRERAAESYIPTIREYSKRYVVNPMRLKLAKPTAIVMHAGPVNREIDIRTEVLEGPQSVVEEMVTNGFALRMALLWLLSNSRKLKS